MSREGQAKVKARSMRGQGKVKAWSRQGQGNASTTSTATTTTMGFDTIEINLVFIHFWGTHCILLLQQGTSSQWVHKMNCQ